MSQYRFNGRTLDTGTRQVTGPRGAVHLPPKPYEVLVELLRQPGQLVTRESLLGRVWPERPASDETLSRTVADLRKYLDDDPRAPRYIETIPKVGYRFVARLEKAPPAVARRRALWLAAGLAALGTTLAVLYLGGPDPAGYPGTRSGILQPPVPLTTEVGDEDTPDFSPDGRHIVYAARDAGGENWEIRIREVATGETRTLVSHPDRDYGPSFAPDGERIAFRRYRGENCEIIVKPFDGPERVLTRCRTPMMSYLDWAPNGREIVFSDIDADRSVTNLKVVDVASGRTRPLLEPADGNEHRFAPRYSPDGSRVAFLQGSFDRNELWIAHLGDGSVEKVTRIGGWVTGATWNADGSSLYFTTARPESALWRLHPGEPPEFVGAIAGYLPAYDPVHGRLVFDSIESRTNIWSIARAVGGGWGEPARRVASTRVDNQPSMSPDANRFAFTSDRSGAWEVWLVGMNGQEPRKMTDWQAEAIDRPDWSPDGSMLVYSVSQRGSWTSYLHRLEGGQPTPLATRAGATRHPKFADDGKSVIYASADGIHRVTLDGGRDETLVPLPGATPLFSLDGTLYYIRPDRPGIYLSGSSGSGPLLTEFGLVVPAAIDEGGDLLYFIAPSPGDGIRRIHTYDPASGTLEAIHPVISDTRQSNVSVSPDGRLVLFSQTEDTHSDLELLEGLP